MLMHKYLDFSFFSNYMYASDRNVIHWQVLYTVNELITINKEQIILICMYNTMYMDMVRVRS